MSYASRVYRQRNAQSHDDKKNEPFFGKQYAVNNDHKKSGFFQAKLSVNQPGDSYEKEADAVASSVVNRSSQTPIVQQKKISGIQRLSTSMEDEKFSTNDARMKKDKDIQRSPMQTGKDLEKEKMKKVQKKDDPLKEKEKLKGAAVQKKGDPLKEKEKLKGAAVQRKPEANASANSTQVSSRLESKAGTGQKLSGKVLHEMNSSFGTDFSKVNVHTDEDSAQMNHELNAQAFTHGKDVYFGKGKFNPENTEGKFLLAHELTHVIQQNENETALVQRMLPCPPHLNENDPVPTGFKPYYGNSSWFHCGFRGILEDRKPTPSDPMNECFYDHSGVLVDTSHPYAGCRGTPDSYDSETDTWDHIFNDPGGIWEAGWDAFWESDRYFSDERAKEEMECYEECQKEPWYLKGFCIQGCSPYGSYPM